jgi:hypothetical protein
MLHRTEGQFCVKHHADVEDDPHRSRPQPLRAENVTVPTDFASLVELTDSR